MSKMFEPGTVTKCTSEYVVNCSTCRNETVEHQRTKRWAAYEFRKSGWGTRDGAWHCPDCLAQEETQRDA